MSIHLIAIQFVQSMLLHPFVKALDDKGLDQGAGLPLYTDQIVTKYFSGLFHLS